MAYSKNPVYAGEAAADFKQSQNVMIQAAEKLEDAIGLINNNLHGTEFEMASAYVGKIINFMQNEVEDTNTALDKLTYLVNEYNSDIYDEKGNKVNIPQVNYHSGKQIIYNGTSGSKTSVSDDMSNAQNNIDSGNSQNTNANASANNSSNNNNNSSSNSNNNSNGNTVSYSVGNNSGNHTSSHSTSGTPVTSYTTGNEPTVSTSTGHVSDYNDYKVAENATTLDAYVKYLQSNKVCQNANTEEWGNKCLGFALTHAYGYFINDTTVTGQQGANYRYGAKFNTFEGDKQTVLKKIYEEINAGRPVVLQVNGNKTGTSRHFVTVVGYKKSVTSGETMTEEDLLIIDSWDAQLETMNGKGSGTRFMTQGTETGNGNYPYRIYVMK